MPIRVPDTYSSSRTLPGTLGGQYVDLRPIAAKTRAVVGVGRIIEQRARELTRERDLAISSAAFNEYRDASRTKMDEFLSQQGENAYSLDSEYNEWFDKFHGDFMAQRFDTNTQAKVFDGLAQNERSRDLDVLGRYMIAEHKRYKKEVSAGHFVTTMKDTTANVFDNVSRETTIANYVDTLKEMNPGRDMTAQVAVDMGKIRAANMVEVINKAPKLAPKYLKEWEKDLGPKATAEFQRQIDKAISDNGVEEAVVELQARNGVTVDGLDKSIEWLARKRNYESLGLDLKQSQLARSSLKTTLAETINRESRDKTEGLNKETSQFVKLLYDDGDRGTAREMLDNSVWLKNHAPQTWARMYKELESVAPKSDFDQFEELRLEVNTNPEQFAGNDDIYFSPRWDKVITKDKQAMHARRDALLKANKTNPETVDIYKRGMSEIKKLEYPGKTDSEKISNRFKAENLWENFFDNNADATPAEFEAAFSEITKGAKTYRFLEIINNLFGSTLGRKGNLEDRQLAIRALIKNDLPVTEKTINQVIEKIDKKRKGAKPKEKEEEPGLFD